MNTLKKLDYKLTVEWIGNTGRGTEVYTAYKRDYTVSSEGKPVLDGSADCHFRGDAAKYNPEDMFIAAAAADHMHWYLHLCAINGITVTDYKDTAKAVMSFNEDHSGRFESITLNPVITITDSTKVELAQNLHTEADKFCFIANSLNFKITYNPVIKVKN